MDGTVLYITRLWILVYLFGESEGRGVNRIQYGRDTQVQQRKYPSQVRRYYYTYYMAYFEPPSLIYARDERDSSRTKTVCTNQEVVDNVTLGVFPCPMKDDPDNFNHCCGESRYEYCCKAIDHPSVKLAIGLGTIAALGIIAGIILCVILKVRADKKKKEEQRTGQTQMLEKGIPMYETVKTNGYTAIQSEDGYRITVKFARDRKYYIRFWEELYRRTENVAWKFSDDKSTKEAKLTLGEGTWVSLILNDDYDGYPVMLVSRETSAVQWMETHFVSICDSLPDDSGCFSAFGFSSKAKTHPTEESESSSSSGESVRRHRTRDSSM